jgi:Tol biopolymer transport system component
MSRFWLASALAPVAAILLAPASSAQAESDGSERHFSAQDLFHLSVAADPQISPDGSRIAYVRRSNDIMADRARSAIWLIDTRTGEEVPLAGGPDANAFAPRWSPDGTRLAYVSTVSGGAQLWVK